MVFDIDGVAGEPRLAPPDNAVQRRLDAPYVPFSLPFTAADDPSVESLLAARYFGPGPRM